MAPIALDNGHSVDLAAKPKVSTKVSSRETEMLVLNTIRCLAGDLTQEYGGGHPGTVMGAAAIGLALWRYQMRFNPSNPDWFARDRFVLSAGHACLLQYLYLHFTGYEAWSMEQIRLYHSPATKESLAAGHPEIEFPGVECTTGPLGQGISNAVGMAIAGKQLGAQYNKEGLEIIGRKIWCFTGDGCIQEGVGQESISLAGHLGLDNLILIYDNNAITVDGNIDACFTDDTSAKLKAVGWEVIEVYDGSNDVPAILAAFDQAKQTKGKPTLVNIRTIIGHSSSKANSGPAHGAALGQGVVDEMKLALGFPPSEKFVVSQEVYDYFKDSKPEGEALEAEWEDKMARYKKEYPAEEKELRMRMSGKFAATEEEWKALLPAKKDLPQTPQATRKSSGIVVQALVPRYKNFVAGSADLMESTFVNFKGQVDFQNPTMGLGDYSGRQIRYGIREFAMVGLGNGMAAYQKGMFIPIMSTFFIFWIYAAPAVRMSALQKLRFVGVATHDSIGIGEDGPTHQPIALAAFYRALPNLNLLRPADAEEVMGAWQLALSEDSQDTPSMICLSRQAVPLLDGTDRGMISKGAYVVAGGEYEDPDLVLIGTGSELSRAIETAGLLKGLKVRVVSMPSQRHFDLQPVEYRRSILPNTSLIVAIEAWSSYGWAKYAHASCSMRQFGLSAPGPQLYDHFGFSPENMAGKIAGWVGRKRAEKGVWGPGDFEELLDVVGE